MTWIKARLMGWERTLKRGCGKQLVLHPHVLMTSFTLPQRLRGNNSKSRAKCIHFWRWRMSRYVICGLLESVFLGFSYTQCITVKCKGNKKKTRWSLNPLISGYVNLWYIVLFLARIICGIFTDLSTQHPKKPGHTRIQIILLPAHPCDLIWPEVIKLHVVIRMILWPRIPPQSMEW